MTIQELALLREAILSAIDDGYATSGGGHSPWMFYADDWRKDSPESNDDRTAFADAVQRYIQNAQREGICSECGGRDGHKTPFCPKVDLRGAVQRRKTDESTNQKPMEQSSNRRRQ